MNAQVIREEVRSIINDRVSSYKFVLVNYFERSGKYSVVLEAKIEGEIIILQASGLSISNVSQQLIEQYDWLSGSGSKRDKVVLAESGNV